MRHPNIVLFLTDDHGAWAGGFAGNHELHTPMLDQLAREGQSFANAFTPCPVCSPARACVLTGQTPSQIGIHDWLEEAESDIANYDWLAGQPTLFDLLKAHGYATALCGKWHLGRSHLPPAGADYHFGLPGWQGSHNQEYTYVRNGERVTLTGNKSRFITDHALDFLSQAPHDRPFFLNVGYIATHSPYGRRHHDPAQTARYMDAAFVDIPPYEPHPWVKNEDGPGDAPTEESLRERYIGYYAAVSEIDQNVQRIVEHLHALGRLDDTLIVYTSDHGCAQGHHGFWGKGNSTRPLNMYETSLRVPLIWRGPGIRGGQRWTQCVNHYDTFQTLSDLTGLAPDPATPRPGASYAPLLEGRLHEDWDDTLIGEYGDLRMVRTPQWKLVWRYPDGPHDLFNLVDDPGETRNLAEDPAHEETKRTLKAQIDAFYARYSREGTSGLRVKQLHRHNVDAEAWRDGRREGRGLQVYDTL
ncbi:MAG: sulfatase-like hydrolase/transferase [Chloroflexota bacterium]|nr:sulfatase-like hydrolase/transferase [Chloroflexota bacterium]